MGAPLQLQQQVLRDKETERPDHRHDQGREARLGQARLSRDQEAEVRHTPAQIRQQARCRACVEREGSKEEASLHHAVETQGGGAHPTELHSQ